MRKDSSVDFSEVSITGRFWYQRLDIVIDATIPSQHRQLEAHGILDSLRIKPEVPPLPIPRNRGGFTTQIFLGQRRG